MRFRNATHAFEFFYKSITKWGKEKSGTKYLKNIAFTIENPVDREITTPWRKFNTDYAEYEWEWYKGGNPDAREISKRAKIWAQCMDDSGNVNSNYGYQWNRGEVKSQFQYVIDELKRDPNTRRAVISIYDGKETHLYSKDTPCTLSISFSIEEEKLDMSVHMRSNDLIWGFCNDQWCFSKLQEWIALEIEREVGIYYHSVVDLHIYERHWNMKNKEIK